MSVFVVSQENRPLMPTTSAKARKLLKEKRAEVYKRTPFTIRLLFETGYGLQPIRVGIDDGTKHAGISLVRERAKKKDQVIFTGEINVDNQIRDMMKKRRNFRRTRRDRLRYRKPRFDNRVKVKCHVCGRNAMKKHQTCREHLEAYPSEKVLRSYWLPPSSKARKDRVVRVVRRLMQSIPVLTGIVETGKFDLQKLKNPDLTVEDYQRGPMYERDSLKAALIAEYGAERTVDDGRKVRVARCCYCLKEEIPVEIEHIYPRSRGGRNNWENLTLACKKCNDEKGPRTPEEAGMTLHIEPQHFHLSQVFKYGAQLQQGKNYLRNELQKLGLDVAFTYGQYTSWQRKRLGIDKTHNNDATVVAITTYDADEQPKVPEQDPALPVWNIAPSSTKTRQKYNATNYSLGKGLPKGTSKNQMVRVGNSLKKLVEVNRACVLVMNEKGKLTALAVRTTEHEPQEAVLVIRKGDVVQVKISNRTVTGKVGALMSDGRIKIQPVGEKKYQKASLLKLVKIVERANSITMVPMNKEVA